jgi:hypothetical protein
MDISMGGAQLSAGCWMCSAGGPSISHTTACPNLHSAAAASLHTHLLHTQLPAVTFLAWSCSYAACAATHFPS